MYDVEKIRTDFPILSRTVNGKPLTYLDNGASAQKPQVVIDAINTAYAHEYANVHRGVYGLAEAATNAYESACRLDPWAFPDHFNLGHKTKRHCIVLRGANKG